MLIAVCVKLVHNHRLEIDLDPIIHRIRDLHRIPVIVNPADMAALELALRIKEQVGAEVVVLTVGSFVPAKYFNSTGIALTGRAIRNNANRLVYADPLRRCLAMGADRVIAVGLNRLSKNQSGALTDGFRPLYTDSMIIAKILAESIRKLNVDLVFCGDHSVDQDNGLVGPATAEFLDWPLVTAAFSTEVEPVRRSAQIRRKFKRGMNELVRCLLPTVVTAAAGGVAPRYFTTRALLEAFKTDIEPVELSEMGLSMKEISKSRTTRLVGFYPPHPRTRKIFIPDASLPPEVRASLAMSGGMNQDDKKGQILEGSAQELATGVIEFMQKHNVILLSER